MAAEFKYELGIEVKSKTTGFKGIIMTRSECLYGCNRYFVQPKVGKDMKIPDGWYVDENDLIFVGEGVSVLTTKPKPKKLPPGGMMSKIR